MSNSDSTLSSYDRVPYESYPFAHLHPARLAATAQLRGYTPPPVAQARVLDIGCGSGGHVIALAAFYPQMQLIGVDLAVGQIARGNERIAAMGLANVSLHAGDLGAGLSPSALQAAQAFGGQFDYILCQGVYYVVPDSVRDAIWRLIDTHLSPSGIAHISFNTYPGWKQREVAQDFAQFYAAGVQGEGAQKEQGVREALAHIAAIAPQHQEGLCAGYGLNLKAESAAAAKALPGLLFHEFISGENRPLYFQQMVSRAQEAGFAYLCEAGLPDAWPGRLGAHLPALLQMAGGDALRLEQIADFAIARTYRNSLWIRAAASAALPHALAAWPVERLRGLQIAADLSRVDSLAESKRGYATASGVSFTLDVAQSPLFDALLRSEQSPLWIAADELLAEHPQSAELLLECVLRSLLQAWREPPAIASNLPDWLRRDAERADCRYLPSVWLQPVGLSAELREQLVGNGLSSTQHQTLRRLGWVA